MSFFANFILDQGVDVKLNIRNFLKWLHSKRDEAVQSIFWSLLFAIAMLIDYSGFLKEGSDNYLDLPDVVGPKGKAMTI